MQQATTAWNFAPGDANRLPELMKFFGVPDEIAPIDLPAFGRRMGELMTRALSTQKFRIENEVEPSAHKNELSSLRTNALGLPSPEATNLVLALRNVPWSDRLTMLLAAAGSLSMLAIATGADFLVE